MSSSAADLSSPKEASATTSGTAKVSIRLRSVGQAPPLSQNKFQLSGNRPILEVEKYLKKTLKSDKALYLYCGSGFSPTPDQLLEDLYACFQVSGELTIMYGVQETWG